MPIVVGGVPSPICYAPAMTAPVNATYTDLAGLTAGGYTSTWLYKASVEGSTQTGFAYQAHLAGSSQDLFWNVALQAWQTGIVVNTSTVSDCVFPAGAFQNGGIYNIAVATADANGLGPFCANVTVTAQSAPTVTVTSPTGTIATALPTFTWLPSLTFPLAVPVWQPSTAYTVGQEVQPSVPNGMVYRCTVAGTTASTPTAGPTTAGATYTDGTVTWEANDSFVPGPDSVSSPQQTSYRVVLYDAGQYQATGFVPGTSASLFDTSSVGSASARSISCPIFLQDMTAYRVYVSISETGGQGSEWAYSAFSTSFTAPVTPTLTAVPSTSSGQAVPTVTLTLTANDTAPLLGTTFATFQYSDTNGADWAPVRNGFLLPIPTSDQQVVVVDEDVPNGFTRLYQAIVTATVGSNTVASDWASAQATAPSSLSWWLSDPLIPNSSIVLSLAPGTFDTVSTDRQQIVPVLTRPDPVVLSDAFGLPLLTFSLVFTTDADYQAFENLRATQHILLLRGPWPMGQYYVRLGPTKNDSTNLPSLRYLGEGIVVRNVTVSAQAVGAP